MLLIALHGAMYSGKDTAFGFIQKEAERRGLVAVRRGFADKLKLSGMRLVDPTFGPDDPAMLPWADALKNGGKVTFTIPLETFGKPGHTTSIEITGRQFWERMGTEAHRDVFGQDFWVDALLPITIQHTGYGKAKTVWQQNFGNADIAVVTDLRFENEAARVHALGGHIWKIRRDAPRQQIGQHASQQLLPDSQCDAVLNNFGTLEQFESVVQATLNNYIGDTP